MAKKMILETPDKIPKSYMLAIGYVMHQWSLLEWIPELISWHLLDLPPKEGRLVFSQMSTINKIRVFRALTERLLPDSNYKTGALGLGKRAKALNAERNKIVHGRWAHPPKNKRTLVHFSVSGSSDNRILPASTRKSAADVRRLGDDVHAQVKEGLAVLSAVRHSSKTRLN